MHAGGLWLWWPPSTQWWYNNDALDLLIWHQSTTDSLTVSSCSNLWESYRLAGWSSMPTQKRALHQPHWPPELTKLPLDIPNFEGKAGEAPPKPYHVFPFMVFIKQHYGWLRQTKAITTHTYGCCCEMVHWSASSLLPHFFLTFLHVPPVLSTTRSIWWGSGVLLSYHQNIATHIIDHIHE